MSERNSIRIPSRGIADNNDLGRIQDFITQAFISISDQISIKNAVIVRAAVGTSDVIVNHGLGRVPAGYIVIDRDAASVVFTSPTSNPSPESQLILRANSSVNVKVMVF